MHITTDLIVFVVLLFPIYQHKFSSDEAAGRFIFHFFGATMLICIFMCILALIPKILMSLYDYYKFKNPGTTFPKEKAPYKEENVMVNIANKIAKKQPNDQKLEDDFGREDP